MGEKLPRTKKRRKVHGGTSAPVAMLLVGVLLCLGTAGFIVWMLAGRGKPNGTPTAAKAPVPEGWKEYSYPDAGFRAYFPKEPKTLSFSRSTRGGGPLPPDVPDIEAMFHYESGDRADELQIEVWVTRVRSPVPESARNRARDAKAKKYSDYESQPVRWLDGDGLDTIMKWGMNRVVWTDRAMIFVSINGPNRTRAKPEDEAAFFDNFELTK